LYLIVDTGAPNTHWDRKRSERLQLNWKEQGGAAAPAGMADSSVCVIEGLELGQFKADRLVLRAHDVSDVNEALMRYFDPLIDGVLGADVLGRYAAVIDYSGLRLYLRRRESQE
jgi:hypothetical protein